MSNKPLNWGWFIIGILKQNLCYPTSLALDCARHPDPLWKFLHGSQHCGHALLAAPTLVPWASKPVAFKGKIRKITTNIDKQWSIVGSFLTENPEAEKNLMPHPICRSFRPVVGTHPSRLSSSPQNCKNTSALSLSLSVFFLLRSCICWALSCISLLSACLWSSAVFWDHLPDVGTWGRDHYP